MNSKLMITPAKRLLSFTLILSILLSYVSLSATHAQALRTYMYKDYVIHSAINENMVLDVDNNNHADGTNIQLWEQNGTAAQVFHIEPSEVEGYYYLVHSQSGKVLDLEWGGTASQTNVQLYTKNGTDAQLWEPLLASGSQVNVTFRAKCGKVLDVCSGASSNGTNIWLFESNGTPAQAFHLVPVDGSNIAYVNTASANLNLRSAPSTSASILAKLPKGTAVEVLSGDENGWTQVLVNGHVGYVSTQYLKFTSASQSTSSSAEQQISAKLKEMMDGSFKNGTYKVGTRYQGPYYTEQCKGFAKSVHQQLFGYNIGSTKAKPYNYQININSNNTTCVGSLTNLASKSNGDLAALLRQARPGDFIQVRRTTGGSHSMIVVSVSDSNITVYEANVDWQNGIQTATYSFSTLRSRNQALSLYSAKDYSLHC